MVGCRQNVICPVRQRIHRHPDPFRKRGCCFPNARDRKCSRGIRPHDCDRGRGTVAQVPRRRNGNAIPRSTFMTGIESKYRAFLSYSHADKTWADWLHKTLESYVVPNGLVGQVTSAGPIPKRLFPIFRDREELPSSPDLNDEMETALRQSLFLIVICSPHACQSHWVNEEILLFKRMGQSDRILALIVDGSPNADGEAGKDIQSECFPAALRFALG